MKDWGYGANVEVKDPAVSTFSLFSVGGVTMQTTGPGQSHDKESGCLCGRALTVCSTLRV